MRKKPKSLAVRETVEVLKPTREVPDMRAALEQLVEQKIAEMMSNKSNGIFEPFFQSKAIAAAIRKRETVLQQRKWIYFLKDWGCMLCHKKNKGHKALGMCAACYNRIARRLQLTMLRAARENPITAVPVVHDFKDVAREALIRKTRP
jgi:hypothetical protein